MIVRRILPLCLLAILAVPAFAQEDRVVINHDTPNNTSNINLLRTDNKEEINHYISAVVELKYAVAYEILPHVNRAVEKEEGVARTMKYTDPETGKIRYFIQIVTTAEQMPTVIETIHSLDLPGAESSEGTVRYHYRLKYRRASEVADVLRATTITKEGRTVADNETNTLFFEDSQSDSKRNIQTLLFYDVPAPQVEFQVIATEISEDDSGKLGLDWDAWKNGLGGQFDLTGNQFEGGDGFARLDALVTVDARAVASFLNYTVQSGTAKVITRSTITASNNRAGVLSSRRRLSFPQYVTTVGTPGILTEKTAETEGGIDKVGERAITINPSTRSFLAEGSAGAGNPGPSALDPAITLGEKAEGIFLTVQPNIGTDMVTADFHVVVNSLAGYSELNAPIITENFVDTEATLQDGEPLILGGLEKETTVRARKGIPLLKDIPVIQYAFSTDSHTTRKAKIYVVVTPTFKNQVQYASRTLDGLKFDTEPPNTVNPSSDLLPPILKSDLPK